MKKLLAPVATVLLCLSAAGTALAAFSDVPQTHKNYVAVTYLNQEGIVNGYEDGTFKPEQGVNRAEALKIILEGNKSEIPASITEVSFSDITVSDWFSPYIMTAKNMGIVSGNPDGTFAPAREVARAEFLKMLLNTNGFKPEKWVGVQIFPDVPVGTWFEAYMNYAGQAGLITKDEQGNVRPGEPLVRGEVAEIMYLMTVILNGSNTQFLITQAELQMAQIDIYVGNNDPLAAKRASELAVDMTQQAYKNMPEDTIVLGAAKLARAYDFLVNSYISGIEQNYDEARDWANQAIAKATEAWEVNNAIQPIAKHIKDRANEIIDQLPAAV